MRLGYRHIDTAAMYRNEEEVGEGLRASGVPRDEVFITTKVWSSDLRARDFERSTRESLEKLKLRNVDLLLIHWPNSSVPLKETIGALCKMKREGLARHVGVSNFDPALIDEAVKLATEPLVNNQIELHPYIDQSKTIAASRKAGLAVTAYSPIARGRVTGDAVLSRIGKAHGKTAAQVCLRYLVQQEHRRDPQNQPRRAAEGECRNFRFQADAGRDEGDRRAGKPARQYRQLDTGDGAASAAQAVRLDHRAGFDRSAGARVLVMQKHRKLRPRLRRMGGGLLEQVMLDVRRQQAPKPDDGFAQRLGQVVLMSRVPKPHWGSMPWQNPRSEPFAPTCLERSGSQTTSGAGLIGLTALQNSTLSPSIPSAP